MLSIRLNLGGESRCWPHYRANGSARSAESKPTIVFVHMALRPTAPVATASTLESYDPPSHSCRTTVGG